MKRIYIAMFIVSVSLALTAAGALGFVGLNYGVDFTGGSVLKVAFENGRPDVSDIRETLAQVEGLAGDLSITPVDADELIIRSSDRTHAVHGTVMTELLEAFPDSGLTERQFDFIGPVIGQELRSKSIRAIIILLLVVAAYIALVFRSMGNVLSSWAMGVAAMVALLHDVIITLGLFAVLGVTHGVQITAVFVAAILTILGYSLSDTVVVFDRVRENIVRGAKEAFPAVVHRSVMQTLVRSINTTVTTLAALVAILLFGGESLQYFALALIVGISLGSYSSIFVASPLLVWFSRGRGR